MAEKVLQAFSVGATIAEIAKLMGIAKSTLYRWCSEEDKSDLKDAIRIGVDLAEAYYMQVGRENMFKNKDFSPTLWMMAVSNRFGWKSNAAFIAGLPAETDQQKVESVKDLVDTSAILEKYRESKKQAVDAAFTEVKEGNGEDDDGPPAPLAVRHSTPRP